MSQVTERSWESTEVWWKTFWAFAVNSEKCWHWRCLCLSWRLLVLDRILVTLNVKLPWLNSV